MKSTIRLAAAAVLAAALAAGCQTTLSLDDERLEQTIRDGIQTQTGLTVAEIGCPDDRPLVAGDEFECTATTSDGRELTVTVTQTDAAGNVNWEVTAEN